ncbi:MAG: class I mannose-6-phosphate isomerase [Acidimicrobiia bacterium]|nr:class I mannose-6-phosphate isomerase [Acidimicrobiia bacterium]
MDNGGISSLPPLVFDPILVAKPWGGRRLAGFDKHLPDEGTFGESWEVADLPPSSVTSSPVSRVTVRGGPLHGATLRELIGRFGVDFLGSAEPTPDGDFPLLVKLLDAREHLSVQVHPTAGYAAEHPGVWLKTESWYVVDADPGSVLFKGFWPGVGPQDVAAAAGTPAIVNLLRAWPAHAGDFHHLPAGVVHALGAGVFVAEHQTPSDTTFRLYDWIDTYPRPPRRLHLEEALETLAFDEPSAPLPAVSEIRSRRTLIDSAYYWLREHTGTTGDRSGFGDEQLRILTVVEGEIILRWDGHDRAVSRGATAVIPSCAARLVEFEMVGRTIVLEAGLV